MLTQTDFPLLFTFNFGLDSTRIAKTSIKAQLQIGYANSQYRYDLKLRFYQYGYV